MIGNKNVLPVFIVWCLVDFFVHYTDEKIPDTSPDPAGFVHKISSLYFSEKEKEKYQHKNDQHQCYENKQGIQPINKLQ